MIIFEVGNLSLVTLFDHGEYGINLRNIHEFSTQEAMSPGTLFPPYFGVLKCRFQ